MTFASGFSDFLTYLESSRAGYEQMTHDGPALDGVDSAAPAAWPGLWPRGAWAFFLFLALTGRLSLGGGLDLATGASLPVKKNPPNCAG